MPNLLTLRRAVAYALDDLFLASVLGSPASTSFTAAALLLATTETGLASSRLTRRYVYHIPSNLTGGQQRIVAKDSWVPASGVFGVQPGWIPPVAGSALEFTGLIPCDAPPFTADTSYRSIINAALRLLLVRDRIQIAITTSQVYSLPSYVTREDRLILTGDADGLGPRPSVWEPAPFGGAPINASWRRPRFVHDGIANLLVFEVPFETASGNIQVDVLRPADTLIAPVATGALADSTTGLVSDGDQISPQIEVSEVEAVAKMIAYEVLANRGDDPTWIDRFKAQVPIAQSQPHYDRGSVPQPPATGQQEAAA